MGLQASYHTGTPHQIHATTEEKVPYPGRVPQERMQQYIALVLGVFYLCSLQEAVLQATRYIPHIVRLQKQMFDEFHHRIDRKRAHIERMADFIGKQPTGMLYVVVYKAVYQTVLNRKLEE